MKVPLLIAAIAANAILFYSCEEDKPVSTESSFGYIQQKILNQSCALSGCHASSQDWAFAEHHLILSEGNAYANLVNIDPSNTSAKAAGLKRVTPSAPDKSLLFLKLSCDASLSANGYGSEMPLGRDAISAGQLEYLKNWIEAGASEDGMILTDVGLLDDNVTVCATKEFIPLEAPALGTGYQLRVDRFTIKPNFEREIFVYKELGNPEDIYINRIEMRMRQNSHHFLVNTFDEKTPEKLLPQVDAIRELRDDKGNYVGETVSQMEYQLFTIASQTSEMNYQFPDGVALKMPANHKLDVNVHYVNKGTTPIEGECYINIHKADPANIVHEAKPIMFSSEDIYLAPNQKTIVIKEFTSLEPAKIFMLTSHTHKLGEYFDVQIKGGPRNGEVIYSSNNWHHPLIKTYSVPVELNAGEGLRMIVTYNNTTSKAVRFGLKSDDEMAIIFGYYY
nr:Copper type II ascorbate-dependent monooxygenase, C-terminal domain protein [uncultured bacterium]